MNKSQFRLTMFSVLVAAMLLAGLVLAPSQRTVLAQDDSPIACDSTLILLLYIAEHNYDYLSGFMMDEENMRPIDYGQFTPLIEETIAMMTAMMEDMSEEEMTAMDEMNMMVDEMMAMDLQAITNAYFSGMGMGEVDLSQYTQLQPGVVAGEDPACTSLRANVEQFILAHIIAESEMMMEDGM